MRDKPELTKKLVELSEVLNKVDLDQNWIISVSALAAQEVAIKRRLNELDVDYGEGEDFQKLTKRLEQAYGEQGIRLPLILLSVSRSYRHIRAKLIHEGHKYRVTDEEADGILDNTRTLLNELFVEPKIELNSAKSIKDLKEEKIIGLIKHMTSTQLTKLMHEAFDEISMIPGWSEVRDNKRLFDFIKYAIKERQEERIQLFEMFFNSFFPTSVIYARGELLSTLAELIHIVSIKNWIIESGHIEILISELVKSRSFDIAGTNTGIILGFLPHLSAEQLNTILEASISNDQIHFSYSAKNNLEAILAHCSEKVEKGKLQRLRDKLEGV